MSKYYPFKPPPCESVKIPPTVTPYVKATGNPAIFWLDVKNL